MMAMIGIWATTLVCSELREVQCSEFPASAESHAAVKGSRSRSCRTWCSEDGRENLFEHDNIERLSGMKGCTLHKFSTRHEHSSKPRPVYKKRHQSWASSASSS